MFFPSFAQAKEEEPLYLLCKSDQWAEKLGKANKVKEEEQTTFTYYIELNPTGTGISKVFDFERVVPLKKYRTYSKFDKTPSPKPQIIYLEHQKNDAIKTKESYVINLKTAKFVKYIFFQIDNPESIFFDKDNNDYFKEQTGEEPFGIKESGFCKPTTYLPRDQIKPL